jgi:hypothetical protein
MMGRLAVGLRNSTSVCRVDLWRRCLSHCNASLSSQEKMRGVIVPNLKSPTTFAVGAYHCQRLSDLRRYRTSARGFRIKTAGLGRGHLIIHKRMIQNLNLQIHQAQRDRNHEPAGQIVEKCLGKF